MQIQVHDKIFEPYISAEDIQTAISRMAREIANDYSGAKPLFISVLNGSFMFSADLLRNLTIEAEICFIKLASYKGTTSTGNIITSIGLDENLNGRNVIILEDIVDTGRTLHAFLPQIRNQQPLSLKICALLHKPDSTIHQIKIDYLGFSIPNKFVVGFGLDYDGLGRNLPEIYQMTK